MFIQRTIKEQINKMSSFFPVILVTGPRQVGKTTLLKNIKEDNRTFVSLDDLEIRALAKNDPSLFFQKYKTPILIDEIQYAPELFPYIKIIADEKNQAGLFWITGSQQFLLMQNVTESLAGRVGIIEMQGFSISEKQKRECKIFVPDNLFIRGSDYPFSEIFYNIWIGSYPRLWVNENAPEYWESFYSSYVQTYIERDVRSLTKIGDELTFLKFMKTIAARIGNLLDYNDIAKDVEISGPTAKAWMSILVSCGIIFLLQPYSNNFTKRIVKTPKLYFNDTGLACWLSGWKTKEVLENGAMSGAFLENFAISEIRKTWLHNGKTPELYFYRDKDKIEIDLLISNNNVL
ncbi:MAG: ATP-binding protein, partial [Sphaerochaetaceae bacterium]|nr:ATP-binding protein [Sphaerochaetaceae bacterium]